MHISFFSSHSIVYASREGASVEAIFNL